VENFLRNFIVEDGLMALCVGVPDETGRYSFHEEAPGDIPSDTDVFFGPAARATKGNKKSDVMASRALWVDADDPQYPMATLPPSAIVFSGHGYHLYWFLDTPVEKIQVVEAYNKILASDVPTGDPSCWNINRWLRVPGTVNTKNDDSVNVVLRNMTGVVYKLDDMKVVAKLDDKSKHKIRTGDSRGYRSRSERDWAILVALVQAGASDELIYTIFDHQPCGDKTRESGNKYLPHTIARVRNRYGTGGTSSGIEERDDGYYVWNKRGARRISTFTIEPRILLDGSPFSSEDAVVGSVRASGYTWPDITFSRSAFTTVTKMDRECPLAAWQWLGRDEDIRALLPFLLEQLQNKGLPKISATSVLGLHFIKDSPYFLGDRQVLGPRAIHVGYDGPLAWLPSKKEHPELHLTEDITDDQLAYLGRTLPLLNEPEVIWPMIGWYAAAPLKPWFEKNGYRFPVLNVAGTKGSGKTTLIQRVFMPLFGQVNPKTYDAKTTRFVVLALLGSSNAVPIAFSEFRYDSVEQFIRFILLSYDTGHDPRGRGDQTTVDYPLSAPFSIDGEDIIQDPAARERIVVAHLHPGTVDEDAPAYEAYDSFRKKVAFPMGFGGFYIRRLLETVASGGAAERLKQAREAVFSTFPDKLPDRVRANHIVAYFGMMTFADAVGIEAPGPEVLLRSISTVYNVETGRSRTLADDMVEDIVNAASQATQAFQWVMNGSNNSFYFQLSSAHSWWLAARRRQGRSGLERDAIRAQIKEAPYALAPKLLKNTYMLGVDLGKAQEVGLDLPSAFNSRSMTVKF
jgi:hypothetical protein